MTEIPERVPFHSAVTIALITVSGGVTMLGILGWIGDFQRGNVWEAFSLFIFPAMIGAALAGVPTATLFGRAGKGGWALAFLGAILATAIGALIGGAIFVALEGGQLVDAIYAPVIVFFSLVTPLTGPLWAATMVAAHIVSRRLREN